MSRKWVGAVVIAGMVLFTLAVWRDLPERIPTHWNFRGELNDWSSRAFGAFFAPVLALLLWLGLPVLRRLDPRRQNYERFDATFITLVNCIVLFMGAMHVMMLGSALGWPIDMGRAAFTLIGVAFIVLGNFLPRVRSNWWMGVRTPWTLENERVWRETHRLAGWTFVGAGVIAIVAVALPAPLRGPVALGALMIGGLLPAAWSYVLWRRYQREGTT
jgi:uncharacterized membrane protein